MLAAAVLFACGDDDAAAPPPAPAPAPPPPPPAVSGLDAVPGQAVAVVGFSPPALAASPLVRAAIGRVLAGDPGLEARLRALLDGCEIDPAADLAQVLVATGPDPTDAVLVATGALREPALVACIGQGMRSAGGELVTVETEPRAIYRADAAGRRAVWFAFGAEDTVIAAPTEAWLRAALGDGDKLSDDEALMAIVGRADRDAAAWAAGRVDPEVGGGLVGLTGGAVAAPPRYMYGQLRLTEGGVDAMLAAVMASNDDAAAAVRFGRPQLRSLAVMAQETGFGPLVSQISLKARKDTVILRLQLSAERVKELVSRIDRPARPE